MGTAASTKWLLDAIALPMDIRNICVFLAPVFSGFTAITTFFFTKECTNRAEAGLFAALFISVIPSYISRSVAGSYDNEAVAIFALVNTFYLWIKACNTGSILWAIACTLQYFFMVAAWGGYSFIINLIPIFVVCIIFANKFNMKIYIAYSVFYVIGTVLAFTIPFVNFNAIKSSEHLASHCVFFAMNAYVVVEFLRKNLPEAQFDGLIRLGKAAAVISFTFVFLYFTLYGKTKWSGRSMSLLDPTYARKYIPIIASVSEHQPTTWTNYFFDCGYLIFFLPVGYYYCLCREVTLGKIFIAIYGVLATYFSCVMIRLMLTLAPIVCVIAGIAVSELLNQSGASIRHAFIETASTAVKPDESEFQRIEKPEEPKTDSKKQIAPKKQKDQKPDAAAVVEKAP
jgi:dolichyl-diphosphooligosaccharide--protein glycosyltransferase